MKKRNLNIRLHESLYNEIKSFCDKENKGSESKITISDVVRKSIESTTSNELEKAIKESISINESLLELKDSSLAAVFLDENNILEQRAYTSGFIDALNLCLDGVDDLKSSNENLKGLIRERSHLTFERALEVECKNYRPRTNFK